MLSTITTLVKPNLHHFNQNPLKPISKHPLTFQKTHKDSNFTSFSSLKTHFQTNPLDKTDENYIEIGNLIQGCGNVKEIRRVNGLVLKYCLGEPRLFLDNNLISGYVKFGCLSDARKVFDEMPQRNVVTWTAMLCGYLIYGFEDEALRLFSGFLESGLVANAKTLVCVLNLCSRWADFELGRVVRGW